MSYGIRLFAIASMNDLRMLYDFTSGTLSSNAALLYICLFIFANPSLKDYTGQTATKNLPFIEINDG